MNLLIMGGDGMLGHQLVQSLGSKHKIDTTLRLDPSAYDHTVGFLPDSVHFGINVQEFPRVHEILGSVCPDAVINATGIVKQRVEAMDAITSLEVNALFPHRLAQACAEAGVRLIQFSTDCVFSGRKGRYRENDLPDPDDLYGRSKLVGEVSARNCITLRTSVIGLELQRKGSLVEWFLRQKEPIRGFRKAIYTGFTTLEMARIVDHVLTKHPDKHGIYHVSSAPIDKFALLVKLRDRLGRDLQIVPDDDFVCDRSLDSSRFQAEFSYVPPSWDDMLDELSSQIKERYS